MATRKDPGGGKKPPRKPVTSVNKPKATTRGGPGAKMTKKTTTKSSLTGYEGTRADYSKNYAKPKVTKAQRTYAKTRTQAQINKGNKAALTAASFLPPVRLARVGVGVAKVASKAAKPVSKIARGVVKDIKTETKDLMGAPRRVIDSRNAKYTKKQLAIYAERNAKRAASAAKAKASKEKDDIMRGIQKDDLQYRRNREAAARAAKETPDQRLTRIKKQSKQADLDKRLKAARARDTERVYKAKAKADFDKRLAAAKKREAEYKIKYKDAGKK
jgi:hypothetical protein